MRRVLPSGVELSSVVPAHGQPVAWQAIDAAFPWISAMRDVPQDPIHHAEGDVWIHTRMVCEALVALPQWPLLEDAAKQRLFAAALLHDVGKPQCTVVEADGRVRSPGHSPKGSLLARRILWSMGWPASRRESVAALVRFHQVPYHLMERTNAGAIAIRLSQTTSARELALLCEADVRGRVSGQLPQQLENIALFCEFCEELGCLDAPYPFASDHARAMYFHRSDRDPAWPAFDDTRARVTMMSGLPGAGKSSWAMQYGGGAPIIALDRIRDELGVDPEDVQGPVIAAARERARVHLRAGEAFVWDATNLSRSLRGNLVSLCYDYGARVRIVHVETTEPELRARNRARQRQVPDSVIDRLLERWEVPDLTEAHEVVWIE
jgi:predicted kinase